MPRTGEKKSPRGIVAVAMKVTLLVPAVAETLTVAAPEDAKPKRFLVARLAASTAKFPPVVEVKLATLLVEVL